MIYTLVWHTNLIVSQTVSIALMHPESFYSDMETVVHMTCNLQTPLSFLMINEPFCQTHKAVGEMKI